MPNGAKQRLAFEVGVDIDEGVTNVDAIGGKIAGLGNTVDKLTKTEERATTARTKAITSTNKHLKSTTALRRGIGETGGAVEGLVASMDKGNEATEKLAQGATSTVSSLLTMGPAAAGIAAGAALISVGIKALIKHLEEMRSHKVWADVSEGIHVWRGGVEELLKAYDELLIKIDENEEKLTKWQRRQKELADDTLTWKDVWLELAYGVEHVRYKVGELGKKSEELHEKEKTAATDYDRIMDSIVERGVKENENLTSMSMSIKAINKLETLGRITLEEKLQLLRDLKGAYADQYASIYEQEELITVTLNTERALQGARSSGIAKYIELEKRLADDVKRVTLDTYDYRLAKLQEDYAEHAKVVKDKKLLEDWYTTQLNGIYEERWNAEKADTDRKNKKLEAEAEAKRKIWNQVIGETQRLTLDETEYAILQIEAQTEAYRQMGVAEVDIARWKAAKIAEIEDKASQGQLDRYRAAAGQAYDIVTGMFAAAEDARQRTQELGLKGTQKGLELERLARLAALAGMIKDELAAQGRLHAIEAITLALGGFWVEAGKHAIVAAAYGVGAAIAGTVARTTRTSYEEGLAREEARIAAEKEAAGERGVPGGEPGGYPGGGGGGGRGATIREAGVVNVRNDINLTVYGAVGIERFKEMVLDIVSGAFNEGRLP